MTQKSGGLYGRATRFSQAINEDEEDFVINDDADDAVEQIDKMKRLDSERGKGGKSLGSARHCIASASTRIVDLTVDQVSYGMRPSTAIQLEQI